MSIVLSSRFELKGKMFLYTLYLFFLRRAWRLKRMLSALDKCLTQRRRVRGDFLGKVVLEERLDGQEQQLYNFGSQQMIG